MSVYTLIPLLPLLASLVIVFAGRRLEGAAHKIVIPAVTASFLLSIAAFVDVASNGSLEIHLYQLFNVGRLAVDIGFYIDALTVLILLLVTGVSTVVQVYSSRYMIGDKRHSRFFAVTALFTAAMTILVMSSNLLLTFIFWEVMGLCSYLLISHYAERRSANRAATKVFLVNSVADVGLGIGVILTFLTFGTLDIPDILAAARAGGDFSGAAITALTLCLFIGAMGKSAQMPAHVWLPLAMEAPTPVSALIHAATMVNAGPFLLVRLSPVIVLSNTAMTVITIVGAVTALFAALVSLTQSDVKKTLAYSTISQLGFMTFLCGVGAFVAVIFHLIAHGFFKAFLFLSTGNVLASTHRHLESAKEKPKRAMRGLFAGAFILSVVPPLLIFSGPYRQLWVSQSFNTANVALWVVGLGTVFFTAMYLFKGINSVFRDGPPGADNGANRVEPTFFSAKHVIGVAVVAVALIAILLAVWSWFAEFLSASVGSAVAVPAEAPAGFSAWVLLPIAVALAGWAFAWSARNQSAHQVSSAWKKRLYVYFLNKGYFDEIYDVYLVRPVISVSDWLWRTVDRGIIDRLVMSSGPVTIGLSTWLWRIVDRGIIDRVVVSLGTGSIGVARELGDVVDTAASRTVERVGEGVDATGRAARRYEPQTLQHNLLVVVVWLVAALGFFYWIA
jgi:NADH-quinone oxidoreductase subunit L